MSTSSIVIESKDIVEHKHAQDHRVVVSRKLPINDIKYEAIRIRIFRNLVEAMKSSVIVFACLALYKITGVHAWWTQFVQKYFFTQ
jgi:hypothetical protein